MINRRCVWIPLGVGHFTPFFTFYEVMHSKKSYAHIETWNAPLQNHLYDAFDVTYEDRIFIMRATDQRRTHNLHFWTFDWLFKSNTFLLRRMRSCSDENEKVTYTRLMNLLLVLVMFWLIGGGQHRGRILASHPAAPSSYPGFAKIFLSEIFSLYCLVCEQYWDRTHLGQSNGFLKNSQRWHPEPGTTKIVLIDLLQKALKRTSLKKRQYITSLGRYKTSTSLTWYKFTRTAFFLL